MLDDYERLALNDINDWYQRGPSGVRASLRSFTRPLGRPVDAMMKTAAAQKAMAPVEAVYREGFRAISHTVPVDRIVLDYGQSHPSVSALDHVRRLSLRHPDSATKSFALTYPGTAGAQGLALGAAGGLPGVGQAAGLALVAADIAALGALSMRMVADYGAHYGFDPKDRREHIFMQGVISLMGVDDQLQKAALMGELNRVAIDISRRATWAELRKRPIVRVIEQGFSKVGSQLFKRQLAIAIPLVGAGAGAAINATYISDLATHSRMAYRKRFLTEKTALSQG